METTEPTKTGDERRHAPAVRLINNWAMHMNSGAHLKNYLRSLELLVLAALLCGCFQATNKFYADSDIVTDSRFEGRFEPQSAPNDSVVPCSAVVKPDHNKHYAVTVREGEDWIKLDAVLFKTGTNLFVDICQVADNAKHNYKGDRPSTLEMLRRGTVDKNHVALRCEFVEDGIEGQIAAGAPFVRAIEKDRTLKLRPVDDHFAILQESTERLRTFLATIANDPAVFLQKSKWVRTSR